MVLSGPPTPNGGSHSQSIPPSMLRSNSGLLGTQRGLVSSRNQYSNMDMLGNVPNVPSFTNQSFGNGGPGPGSIQRGGIDTGAEPDQHSGGNGMGLNAQSLYAQSNHANPGSSGQVQGQQFPNPSSNNQIMSDQQRSQQLEHHNFQHGRQQMHQFSSHHTQQQQQAQSQQQQQQFQSIQGGLGGVGAVKLEPQATNVHQQQHLQSLRNLGPVKFEPQQTQTLRNFAPVKMEPHHADDSLFLHQQQQQQQISNQSSQAAAAQINLLHQQRLLQLHQHQQQQLLKGMPQQRSQLQQQFQQQGLPLRSPVKPVYEPGMCARRLTHYMYQQQHRPEDNSIEFWRKFVAEYYAPHAKKKWCVSLYGNGRQTTGVFPQDAWQCEICNRKPGRGFEATAEVLPRLFKIKYESGTLEELLYVDMPREYQNSSGQIILDYTKAVQESVFEQLRVVRDGPLRIVFSPDLKICSWEFCARRHEELIPRRLLVPQVSQLGAAAQKYQAATQIASSSSSNPELQSNCNMFVASARQLAKALDVPLVNDLGYTKRYVRCLQISEVVNSMKDLIDYSREIGTGPMESLAKFPRKTTASSGFNSQAQQEEDQLQQHQQQTGGVATSVNNYSSDCSSVQTTAMQIAGSNGVGASVNNSASTSANTIVGLLHQSSMNSRQQSSMNNPYGGSVVQAPSPGSSTTLPQAHPNHSPTPSSSNNNPPLASHGALNHMSSSLPVNMPMQSGDADTSDQSSVQKILHQVMMSSQLNGGNDAKNGNGISATGSNSSIGGSGAGFSSNVVNGMRAAMANNSTMSGRVGNGMTSMAREQNMKQQQDPGNQLLGFNNLQFDWKTSP